jgi:hypothetical protein
MDTARNALSYLAALFSPSSIYILGFCYFLPPSPALIYFPKSLDSCRGSLILPSISPYQSLEWVFCVVPLLRVRFCGVCFFLFSISLAGICADSWDEIDGSTSYGTMTAMDTSTVSMSAWRTESSSFLFDGLVQVLCLRLLCILFLSLGSSCWRL